MDTTMIFIEAIAAVLALGLVATVLLKYCEDPAAFREMTINNLVSLTHKLTPKDNDEFIDFTNDLITLCPDLEKPVAYTRLYWEVHNVLNVGTKLNCVNAELVQSYLDLYYSDPTPANKTLITAMLRVKIQLVMTTTQYGYIRDYVDDLDELLEYVPTSVTDLHLTYNKLCEIYSYLKGRRSGQGNPPRLTRKFVVRNYSIVEPTLH